MAAQPAAVRVDTDAVARLHHFTTTTRLADVPEDVRHRTRLLLLDLAGVAAAGSTTRLSAIIRDHAVRFFGSATDAARMMFDGRQASAAGAAMAGGMTIDSIDAHDGMRETKGHMGVAILPALLAWRDAGFEIDGAELLAGLAIGYDVGTRAGIALHATAPDYHTSGAWNSLACAALGGRLMGLDLERFHHALGIAEYHGPRSQMMRCIDYPTMLKDGSGWGAMEGISAAHLAADGFTGAPALTVGDPAVRDLWADLGTRWTALEQYVKLYPVCRWAQPAVEAAMAVMREHAFAAGDIRAIEVVTFHEGTRLAMRHPADTEQAQYSLPFPVAAALAKGVLGVAEIDGPGLEDPEIARLADAVTLSESDDYNAKFPAERWAHVRVELADGRVLESPPSTAKGDPDAPLSEQTMIEKFHGLAGPVIGESRARQIEQAILALPDADTAEVADLLSAPAEDGGTQIAIGFGR